MLSQKLSEFLSKIPLDFRSKTDLMHNASLCSCSTCDSISCFKLRNKNSALFCSCSNCKPSISCIDSAKCYLHIPTEKIKEKPHSKKGKKHIEKQCVHESIDNQKQSIHKSTNEKKQVVYETTTNDKKQSGHESNDNKKENVREPISNKKSESNKHSHTTIKSKDKTNEKNIAKYYEKSLTQIESIVVTYTNCKKDRDISKAELSAQIMNVPYEKLKDSLSIPKSNKDTCTDSNEKPSFNTNVQMIPDILTRLKEIYKVCSCKVCECIPKISLPPKVLCTCSPCDCDECTNSPNLHSRCPCVKCVRKDCRGIVKKTQEVKSCNCKPCECMECMDRSNRLCNCEPCQCAECAMNTLRKRSIILAHVQGSFSQNTCQCEPCECANCTYNYSTVATNLRRDISTDISYRHCQCGTCLNNTCQSGREDCRCDQNKIMRKPVQNDSHDYDIHRTVLSDQNVRKYYNNFDTIAMFALSDNYSNSVFHSNENCKCLECECLMCKKREKTYSNKKSSKYLSQDNLEKLNNICKCVPCECEICTGTKNKIGRSITLNTTKSCHTGCACNICDCVLCKGIRYDKTYRNTAKEKTAHFIFEPATKDIPYENIYPLKKGKLLTPSAFEAKISLPSRLSVQSCFNNKKMKKPTERRVSLKVNSKESFHTKLSHHQKFTVCCTDSKQNFLESENSQQILYRNIVDPIINNFLGNINFTNQVPDGNKTYIVSSNSNIHLGKSRADSNIFNNNLHSPLNVSMEKTLEKYLTDRNSNTKLAVDNFDNNTIVLNSNVVDNIDEPMLHMIKGEQSKLQEKDDIAHKTSILSIYKSPSKSITCDNISIARYSEGSNLIDSENRNATSLRTPKGDRCVKPAYNKSNNIISHSNMVIKRVEVVKSGENNEINETIHKDILNNKNKNKRFSKRIPMYNKMYRRLLKRIRVSEMKKTRRQRRLEISNLNDEHNRAKERLEDNLEEKTENRVDVRTNDIINSIDTFFSPELNMLNKIKTEVENIDKSVFNMPWPILRKNISLNCAAVRKSMGVCTIPGLEMDIKCPKKSVSLSTASDDYDNKTLGKKALNRLLVEVNNLLNSPLLRSSHSCRYLDMACQSSGFIKQSSTKQIQMKYNDAITQTIALTIRVDKDINCNILQSMENLQNNIKYLLHMILERAVKKSDIMTPKLIPVEGLADDLPKVDSVKSSCEGLKAIFIGLRKVSDHTLLVRWKAPPKIADIQGYELQVDGRSVQKIFSPTRCMAILTCLPHCNKILLTIRTLTTSEIPSDHYPASTIVYRPKLKYLM